MSRSLHVRDAARMAEIHAQSFYKGWPAAEMHKHVTQDLCFGHGRPLDGFLILRHAGGQAEILTIAIDRSARRQGIAGALLDVAETELLDLGVELLFLEVAEDNEPAKEFYKKHSFKPIGRRPAYYKRKMGRVAALNFKKALR